MQRTIASLALVLCPLLLFCSCEEILYAVLDESFEDGEFIQELLFDESTDSEESQETEESQDSDDHNQPPSTQPVESEVADISSQPEAEQEVSSASEQAVSSESKPQVVEVKSWVKEVVNGTNSVVKGYYDGTGAMISSELWMGGLPTVYYYYTETDISYFQLIDNSANINEIWNTPTTLNSSGLPDNNVFPNNFAVEFMHHQASDLLSELFVDVPENVSASKDIAVLNNFLGINTSPRYEAAVDQGGYSVPQRWIYEYSIDGITILMLCTNNETTISYAVLYPTDRPPTYATY